MRVIEKALVSNIDAIAAGQRSAWSSSNTAITRVSHNCLHVRLHDNHIATLLHDDGGTITSVTLYDAGWQTVTTKSRLNVIASAFGVMGIYHRAFTWRFDDGTGFENGIAQDVRAPYFGNYIYKESTT